MGVVIFKYLGWSIIIAHWESTHNAISAVSNRGAAMRNYPYVRPTVRARKLEVSFPKLCFSCFCRILISVKMSYRCERNDEEKEKFA